MRTPIVLLTLTVTLAAAEPVRLRVDFSKPDGTWNMPALALGQGGLQSDPMIEPHIKELRQLRPQTIRLFLSEYYRIYPARGIYDWTKLDRELRAVRATGARPALALDMKPPVLYPKVDHLVVHPNSYDDWEQLCEALAKHCREQAFNVAAREVCNEPDIGESGGTPHFFRKAEDYNRFYTHTVTALLRGDPDAQVGGPTVASADSFLVEGLIAHCATQGVPLHFLSWHLYSDSPGAHAGNIAKQRARLAKFPQLPKVKLFISEWNMDLMRPNLAPGFQPCFVLETMRRYAEAKLDMAAYYHIRDCFVDPADFDWMSPGGRRFMAHCWNTMPQYSALFDHHGRVRLNIVPVVAGLLCAAHLCGADPGNLRLNDLWEDTPVTKNLLHQFRIYKRKELPSHLHQQMRLYLVYPEQAQPSKRRPAVVFIHGGGWSAGNPDQWFPQCRYFALRGIVGVSVQYRLKSDTTTVADCLADCKSAIRHLRRNATELGIDPNKIIVVGESAGGHLAAALGTIEGYDEPGEDAAASAVPNALLLLNPITDMTTRWGESLGKKAESLSPLHHITKKTPPTMPLPSSNTDPISPPPGRSSKLIITSCPWAISKTSPC